MARLAAPPIGKVKPWLNPVPDLEQLVNRFEGKSWTFREFCRSADCDSTGEGPPQQQKQKSIDVVENVYLSED